MPRPDGADKESVCAPHADSNQKRGTQIGNVLFLGDMSTMLLLQRR